MQYVCRCNCFCLYMRLILLDLRMLPSNSCKKQCARERASACDCEMHCCVTRCKRGSHCIPPIPLVNPSIAALVCVAVYAEMLFRRTATEASRYGGITLNWDIIAKCSRVVSCFVSPLALHGPQGRRESRVLVLLWFMPFVYRLVCRTPFSWRTRSMRQSLRC